MKLIPFTPKYYSTLVNWIPDAEFNLLWGGPVYHWPLDEMQIDTYLQNQNINAYLLMNETIPIGYIELLRLPDDRVRLCRILVANPADRGKGYGKKLIELAMEKAKTRFGAKEIELGVFERNTRALDCYKKLGFKSCLHDADSIKFNGEPWPLIRMKRGLE